MYKRKTYLQSLLPALLFWLPYSGGAQNFVPYIQKLSLEDGLSSPYFNSFLQDSRGVIWFGTNYGLNRYDGTAIKSYTKEDNGLCHNNIRGLSEDGNGNLWILSGDFTRTKQFFCIFDPIAEVFYTVEEYTGAPCPFDPNRTNLSPGYNGVVLFNEEGNSSYGIYEADKNQLRFLFDFQKSDSFYQSHGWDDVVKLDGDHFLATTIINASQQQKTIFNSRGEILQNFPCRLLPGRDMEVLNGHLCYTCFEDSDSPGESVRIYKDNQKQDVFDLLPIDNYFISNERIYHLRKKGDQIILYDPEFSKPQHRIELDQKIANTTDHLFGDNGGGLWYQANNEIHRLSLRKQFFELPIKHKTRWPKPIRGIDSSPEGTFYTGSIANLYIHSGGRSALETVIEKSVEGINGLLYDGGAIWMAIEGKNTLWQYFPEKQESKFYKVQKGLNPQGLLWIPYKAPDGSLWVGAANGVLKLDTLTDQLRNFKNYNGFSALTTSSVYAFHLNEKGTWLSTSSGMYLADLEQEKVLACYSDTQAPPFYIPGNHITHIYEDKQGIFWLATKGQGLIRWDPGSGKSEQLTRKNSGLSNNVLYAVYEDDFGNLWLPSNHGLMCLNKISRQVTIFLEADGLPHNEFNTIAHHQDKAGNLYFGTQDGLIRFHPKDFKPAQENVPLMLASCYRVDRQTDSLINRTANVLTQHRLTIQPGDKAVEFSFALLDYSRTKGNEYSYKIVGYHNDWIYQKEGSFRISGLPYGEYQLLVRAKASGSNTWVDYAQPIDLTFAKPFYLTWWAISLAISMLIVLLYFIRKYQIRRLLKNAESQRLQEIDLLKTKLYTNITHEFRTPLTVILGMSQNIRDNLATISTQAIDEHLHLVQRNGRYLLNLINQMLDLSKLDKGHLNMHWELGDVILFLQYLSESFYSYAATKEIQLTFYPEVRSLEMDYDREKLQHIISNLLSNALKFTPQGGKVIFHVSEIPASTDDTGTMLKMKISNTGIGISEEHITYIFDRFYQVDGTHTRSSEGSGIGLALTKNLVELMGGRISVKSKVDEGAEFTVLLPVRKTALPSQALPQIETAAAPSVINTPESMTSTALTDDMPLLLLIEDNADVATYIRSCMKDQYTVLWAKNGQLGIDKALETIPDIIISDVMMPEKDGYEVTHFLKNDQRTSHIPIILLTAKATIEDKIIGLERGADAYLSKPFDKKELQVRVEKLVALRKALIARYAAGDPIGHQHAAILAPDPSIEKDFQFENAFLKKINEIIEKHLSEAEFEVPQLSRELTMSHSQLYRKIKALTGLSIAGYIRNYRLHQARTMLETTDLNISQVAYNVGFTDPSYFSRMFFEVFGETPSSIHK